MVNKKIILSILAIGMLAVVAGAGTYAYVQDTLKVTGSGVATADFKTSYIEDDAVDSPESATWTEISGGTLARTVTPDIDILPAGVGDDTDYVALKKLMIKNANVAGGPAADVYLKVTPVLASGETTPASINGLIIKIGDQLVYSNGAFTSVPVPVKITNLAAGVTKDLSVKYTFPMTEDNQNDATGKSVGFTYVVYVVPVGTAAPIQDDIEA